jgi:hypothetical protein
MRERFDPARLDPDGPFEIDDGNRPHLAKHAPYSPDDLIDVWADPGAVFLPAAADGPADWLLLAAIPGDLVQVPVAPSASDDPTRCRPLGIYEASRQQAARYREENSA